jgi:hypothetical protein
MNRFDQNWQKLVALARQAPPMDSEPLMLPPGFATRVAALAATTPAAPWGGLERLALRGFVAATACCAAVVAYSYFGQAPDPIEDPALDETLHAMLDLS